LLFQTIRGVAFDIVEKLILTIYELPTTELERRKIYKEIKIYSFQGKEKIGYHKVPLFSESSNLETQLGYHLLDSEGLEVKLS
jgi:hypothetical protein